jgi:hypothetical protein
LAVNRQSPNNSDSDYDLRGSYVLESEGTTKAREAEESPLLEAVTRKRLVMTLQSREDLVFAAVICNVWKLAMAL